MGAPFITTGDLSDRLGTNAATTRGTAVITAACDVVRTLTEQNLTVGTTTWTADGTGTPHLLPPERPILNAGTVIEGGGTLTFGSDYTVSDADVLYRLPGVVNNSWGCEEVRTYWWPGKQNITVTYEHGYASVPSDLKEVALGIAARLFAGGDGGVVFESLGQHQIRRDGPASSLAPIEQLIIDKYRQHRR